MSKRKEAWTRVEQRRCQRGGVQFPGISKFGRGVPAHVGTGVWSPDHRFRRSTWGKLNAAMEQAGEGGLGAEFGVRLVREGLESVMAAEVASSIVFAALEQDGGQALPASAHELFQFIRGPLLAVLKRRVGESKAGDAVRAAEELIGKGIAHVKAPPSYQTTMRLPSIVGPVAVLFVRTRTKPFDPIGRTLPASSTISTCTSEKAWPTWPGCPSRCVASPNVIPPASDDP